GNDATPASVKPCSALELLVAFAVIAAALFDPFQAAIGVGGLVGVVLIDAGVHPRLAGRFLGVFRIDRGREHRRQRRQCRRGGSRRRGFLLRLFRGRGCGRRGRRDKRRGDGCRVGAALGLAEIVPLLAGERAGGLGGLIFRAAFLRGEGLRRGDSRERGKTC